MKKVIIIFVFLTALMSIRCEKEPIYLEDDCWRCVDQYNKALPPIETLIICDPVEASLQNTKKHYKDKWGKWHDWTCTPI
jgi:hypothetical protein